VLNTDQSKFVLAQGLANMQAQQGYESDWGAMFAAVTITILPVLVVYVFFQRQLQGGVSRGSDKSASGRRPTGARAPGLPDRRDRPSAGAAGPEAPRCDGVHPGPPCRTCSSLADCSSCLRGPTCPVPFSEGHLGE